MSNEYRTLKDVQGRLDAVNAEMHSLFQKGTDNLKTEDVEKIRELNTEATDLGKKREELRELETIREKTEKAHREANTPANGLPAPQGKGAQPPAQPVRGMGELFAEAYAKRRGEGGSQKQEIDLPAFDVKTLMTTTAGFAPESVRTGRIVYSAQRRPLVADLLPGTTTDQAVIKYMEETTFTNNAAPVAEAGTYAESALAFTERSVAVEKVGTWLPVTDEQLEDEPQIRSIIDNRLTLMLLLAEENQLLNGNGSTPQLTGINNKSGIQTQAKGSDPVPDAVYKAMTKIQVTGRAEPSGVIMHPNDWQDIRLLRTADGIYIWGNPSEAGPERLWGLPVVQTTAQAENTGLVGDFQMYSEVFRKRGITIKITDSHGTYFIEGKNAIRIDERLTLAIYRAAAFCQVTSI